MTLTGNITSRSTRTDKAGAQTFAPRFTLENIMPREYRDRIEKGAEIARLGHVREHKSGGYAVRVRVEAQKATTYSGTAHLATARTT